MYAKERKTRAEQVLRICASTDIWIGACEFIALVEALEECLCFV